MDRFPIEIFASKEMTCYLWSSYLNIWFILCWNNELNLYFENPWCYQASVKWVGFQYIEKYDFWADLMSFLEFIRICAYVFALFQYKAMSLE